jgi:hypothetical protein
MFRVELPAASRPRGVPTFDHTAPTHRTLKCTACHAITDRERLDFAPGTELASCASCHSDHTRLPTSVGEAAERLVQHLTPAEDSQRCDRCHVGGTVPRPDERSIEGAFEHRHHLPPGEAGRAAQYCDRCHPQVDELGQMNAANYASFFLPGHALTQSCGECHVTAGADAVPTPIPTERTPAGSVERGISNFDHSSHAEHMQGCSATGCHAPAADGEPTVFPTYTGCVACHSHTEWAVENHPGNCTSCHVDGVQADTPRADARIRSIRLERLEAVTFRLVGHQHPHVTHTQTGGAVDRTDAGECRQCHLSTKPELLRPAPRAFSHYWHLPETPTQANCLGCHGNLVSEAYARATTPIQADALVHPEDCSGCHRGSSLRPEGTPTPAEVPFFDHATHLADSVRWAAPGAVGRRALTCADCHEPTRGADPADSYSTRTTAANCTECHGHDPATSQFQITGSKTGSGGSGGEACDRCHRIAGTGPFLSGRFQEQRFRAVLATAPQYHDQSGGCAHCHGLEDRAAAVAGDWLVDLHNPHLSPATRGRANSGACLECHADHPHGRNK